MKSPNDNHLTNKLQVLTEVSKTLATSLDLTELLQLVLDQITEVLEPADVGILLLWDSSSRLLRPQAASGTDLHDREAALAISFSEGESMIGEVFAESSARLLLTAEDIATGMSSLHSAKRAAMTNAYGSDKLPQSAVAVPLRKDTHKYGVLMLETVTSPVYFSDVDLPFIQALADLIALEIDRARLDAEAAVAQQVQEEDRLRSEVMAALSHELRTPLASIKGYVTALMLEEVTWSEEKRLDFLHLIDEETDNLERMVSDIMDASLIDIGQLKIEPQPVRLPLLAQDVAQEMQHLSTKHQFVVDFPDNFPIVEADPPLNVN